MRYKCSNKEWVGCQICGFNSSGYALDFHHVAHRSTRKRTWEPLDWGRNDRMDKVIDDINKCIILCANCYRILHHGGD